MFRGKALISILVCCIVGWMTFSLANLYYYEMYLGEDLRRDLGFRHGTPYLSEDGFLGLGIEPVTVEYIEPGGIFDKAGFQEDDILRGGMTSVNLYRTLEQARGRGPVVLEVSPWDQDRPLSERPVRQVIINVPTRK